MLEKTQFPYHIQKGILAAFDEGTNEYAKVNGTWRKFTQIIPSNASAETQAFLGQHYNIQEWTDQLSEKDFKEYSLTLTNKKYGDKLVIDQDLIEDDQTGSILARARSLGEETAKFFERTAYGYLAGNTLTGYDSKALFANDHDESGSNQDNLGSTALSYSAVDTTFAAMANFTDDQGDPIGVRPNTIIVPPALRATALQIANSELQPGADSDTANAGLQSYNAYKDTFEVIDSPYLTSSDANDWYMMDLNHSVKPLVWQERVKPSLLPPVYDEVNDRWIFNLRFRGVFGIGKWAYAYKHVVS